MNQSICLTVLSQRVYDGIVGFVTLWSEMIVNDIRSQAQIRLIQNLVNRKGQKVMC